jgi:hypothetical protein
MLLESPIRIVQDSESCRSHDVFNQVVCQRSAHEVVPPQLCERWFISIVIIDISTINHSEIGVMNQLS